MADGTRLSEIEWGQPWFAPFRYAGEPAWAAVEKGASVAQALNDAGAAPVRFVSQSALEPGEAYEAHVARTAEVPTRDNLHDFFNGLCWLAFPALKRQLNLLQAQEIAAAGVGPGRGPVRDAITLLDENGAFLDAPLPLREALVERDWRLAFIGMRQAWIDARLTVFGHALLEKLVTPRKELTAHVWRLPAAAITRDLLASKPFTPLPILGVPGWWPENGNFSFYDDSSVFRPARCPSPLKPHPLAATSRAGDASDSPTEKPLS